MSIFDCSGAEMRCFFLLITTVVLLLGLTACGQKGPLYLPEPAPVEKPDEA